jgi:hypothetical protein
MGKVLRALLVREKYGDVIVGKTGCLECVDAALDACLVRVDAKHCDIFACHLKLPYYWVA